VYRENRVVQTPEKGRVENAVGYIKKNFLAGLELTDFALLNPAARQWLDTVANVRLHGSTKRQPAELFQAEKLKLRPLPIQPYDVGILRPVRASRQFRVTVDANTYSVPAEYAGAALTLKLYPDHLCLYQKDRLIARHVRCYDRRRDFENPDHPRALLQQRRRARDQKLLQRLLSLTPRAEGFYQGLAERRLNVLHHVRQIVALAEIYGSDQTARAIEDALEFQAFSGEYNAILIGGVGLGKGSYHCASPGQPDETSDLTPVNGSPGELIAAPSLCHSTKLDLRRPEWHRRPSSPRRSAAGGWRLGKSGRQDLLRANCSAHQQTAVSPPCWCRAASGATYWQTRRLG